MRIRSNAENLTIDVLVRSWLHSLTARKLVECIGGAMSGPIQASASDTPHRLHATSRSHGYSYLSSRPDVAGNPTRLWPTILFLHGAAERGKNVGDVARQGLPKLLEGAESLTPVERATGRQVAAEFVVIAPQCPPLEVWDDRELLRLLDESIPTLAVDPQRLYLSGLSMGGFAAWTMGIRQSRRFAALIPICGGGRIADISRAIATDPAGLRSLGIWAFHGAHDRVVPVEESERMVTELHRVGVSDARLTIYPNAEHDAWSETYANPDLYRWMLTHQRSP